jgi:anti-sigma regulatory factor (Ser/Thr protein kinase)
MAEVSKNLENSMKVSKTKNLMLMLGKEKSESTKVGKCIKQAIEELTGKPNHYPPIYGIIQEMNGNSVEHAYKIKKHWILGINHDKTNNKMIFTFTDNGFGILRTLKRRFNKKVFDNLQWYKDEDILNGVFDKKYNSRFKKQYNRNKGLPVIKKAYIEDKINNLIVISNKAFLDFENKTSISLKNEFSGTFYYWELDLNTYRYGKNIN